MAAPSRGRAIVVGGGIAGTAAAYRFVRHGWEVTLLESEPEVAGRTGTVEKDGFRIDTAATMMLGTYRRTVELVAELGLDRACEPGSALMAVTRDARAHRIDLARPLSAAPTPLLSARAKGAVLRIARDVVRHRRVLNWNDTAGGADIDLGSARDYADSRVRNDELRDHLLDPACRFLGLTSMADVAAVDFLMLAAYMSYSTFFNHPGGMSFLARTLASTATVRCQTTVLSVEEKPDEVVVTSRGADGAEHTDTADACVIATPAPVLTKLWVDLDPERRAILNRVRYSPAVNVAAGMAEAPPEPAALVLVPSSDDPELACYGLDHNKASGRAPDGAGLITTYWHRDWSEAQAERPDEDVVDEVVDRLKRFVPGMGNVVTSHVARWDHALVTGPVDRLRGQRDFRLRTPRSSRVRPAGDTVSASGVEACLCSGERAADELVSR